MKNTLYGILITIILGLVYLKFFLPSQPVTTNPPSVSPTPIASTSPAVLEFTTPYFSLDYPTSASASAVDGGPDSQEWRVNYMGDIQRASGRTQTELFDGYAVTITRFEAVGETVAMTQAEADRQGIVDGCGEENATEIKSATLGQYSALTYYGGCLGEANYFYIERSDALYRLTQFVTGSETDSAKYLEITDAMLSSLTFTD